MSNTKKILITDQLHPLLQAGLEQDGFIVDYEPQILPEKVVEIIEGYTGLVINSKVFVGKQMLDRATQLKFVCRAGSGLEVIDLPYAKSKGIAAFNSPEGNRNAVAEQALGMLLSIMNNLQIAYTQVKNKEWIREPNRGNELSGKTVALIAYGNTAQAFAKVLAGFDITILAYDKYYKGFTTEHVKEATLEEIFEQADVVSLHLPLTQETEYLIDYAFLSSFKKPIWLINTSRGKVLQTSDVITCMQEGKIRAAALDVLENEKLNILTNNETLVFEKLIADNRILLSPHIAGWTHESKEKIATVLLQKIRNLKLI